MSGYNATKKHRQSGADQVMEWWFIKAQLKSYFKGIRDSCLGVI
jgi:hypothetical protein